MFELFLNAARFAVSEDVRKSASGIIELIRRSPEWQHDICTLQARVSRSFAEQTYLLSGLTSSKMENLQYPKEAVEAFKISYSELVTNAFEYGCQAGSKGTIGIEIDVTKEYVALTVLNSKGFKLNLSRAIESRRMATSRDPESKRGRGLTLVAELADTLEEKENQEGVKAVFYKDRVSFRIDQVDGLIILELTRGLFNPSIHRRFFETAVRFIQYDLILDFLRWTTIGTKIMTQTLELRDLYARSGSKIVALLFREYDGNVPSGFQRVSSVRLPTGVIAYSWEEALNKVGRPDLLEKVKQLKQSQRR